MAVANKNTDPTKTAPAQAAASTQPTAAPAKVEKTEAEKAAAEKVKVDKFKQIAARRTVVILKTLGFLENCANKGSYSYTPEQVATIFNSIEAKVKDVKAAFNRTGATKDKITIEL
jgi:hypothetical protein